MMKARTVSNRPDNFDSEILYLYYEQNPLVSKSITNLYSFILRHTVSYGMSKECYSAKISPYF